MPLFNPQAVVTRGRGHRRLGQPSQDAALAAEGDDFAVVAVADGVGDPLGERRVYEDGAEPSATQIGAGLTARIAVDAVMRHLDAGGKLAEVELVVRQALLNVLGAIRDVMTARSFDLTMPATLILGVITDSRCDVWAAGDGEAFIAFEPNEHQPIAYLAPHVERMTGGYLWRRAGDTVSNIPVQLLDDPTLAIPELVMSVDADVAGVYVATDGFAEARNAQLLLREKPDAFSTEVKAALERTFLETDPRALKEFEKAAQAVHDGRYDSAVRRLASLAHPSVQEDDASVAWANRIVRRDLIRETLPRRRAQVKRRRLSA